VLVGILLLKNFIEFNVVKKSATSIIEPIWQHWVPQLLGRAKIM